MLEIFKAIIYGIIQGISEWLPISSTAHLLLLEKFIPLKIYDDLKANEEFFNLFLVIIQLASIIAIVILYFKDLNPITNDRKQKKQSIRLWFLIVIGSIPAGILGILFDDFIDHYLHNVNTIIITLIIFALIFLMVEKTKINTKISSLDNLNASDAFKVGLFQVLALIPGVSRSGATIMGSRLMGINRSTSASFSFFLAIPVMFGASLLKIIKIKIALSINAYLVLLIASFVSFVISYFVVKSLLSYIRKHNFSIFAYYRIALGLILIFLVFKGII